MYLKTHPQQVQQKKSFSFPAEWNEIVDTPTRCCHLIPPTPNTQHLLISIHTHRVRDIKSLASPHVNSNDDVSQTHRIENKTHPSVFSFFLTSLKMRILVLVEPTFSRIHKKKKKNTEGHQKIKDGTDGKDNKKKKKKKKLVEIYN